MSHAKKIPWSLLRHPFGWIATGLGSGLVPWAPGTFGSIAAIIPYIVLRQQAWWWVWIAIALLFVAGIRAGDWVIAQLQREDPGAIVVDEWVGLWITLGLMDLALRYAPGTWIVPSNLAFIAVGLIAFRVCDIAKPWPASWADRQLHGGFGTMLDDALAAIWAGLLGAGALYAVSLIKFSSPT